MSQKYSTRTAGQNNGVHISAQRVAESQSRQLVPD